MRAEVDVTDNSDAVRAALQKAIENGLDLAGRRWVSYAKGLAPNWERGMMRNSIDYTVEKDQVTVGSNMEIAAYAELGTSIYYEEKPEYIELGDGVHEGVHQYGRAGIAHWLYYDELTGEVMVGSAQKPRHFLRDSFERHKDEFMAIIETALREAEG